MFKKIGMLGLMLFGTGAVMLPQLALADDHYPAARADYHHIDRAYDRRDFRVRNDYRGIEIRNHDEHSQYDVRETRGRSEYRNRAERPAAHFRPEGRR